MKTNVGSSPDSITEIKPVGDPVKEPKSRESGYYWTKIKGAWFVTLWIKDCGWVCGDKGQAARDSELDEIDERKIERGVAVGGETTKPDEDTKRAVIIDPEKMHLCTDAIRDLDLLLDQTTSPSYKVLKELSQTLGDCLVVETPEQQREGYTQMLLTQELEHSQGLEDFLWEIANNLKVEGLNEDTETEELIDKIRDAWPELSGEAKTPDQTLKDFLIERIQHAFAGIENGGAEHYPFDGHSIESLEGMKRAYSDVLTELPRLKSGAVGVPSEQDIEAKALELADLYYHDNTDTPLMHLKEMAKWAIGRLSKSG